MKSTFNILISLLLFIGFSACKEESEEFYMSTYDVTFDQNGTAQIVTVSSSFDWEFDVTSIPSWCRVQPLSGRAGTVEVTLSPEPFTERAPREKQFIKLMYNKTFSILSVSQDMPNNAPSAPELLAPSENDTGVRINGLFTWRAASDPDGDAVVYTLMLSPDNGANWNTYHSETTSCKPSEHLSKGTSYLWKVVSSDPFGGKTESATRSFRTSDGRTYADGEIIRYQIESAGAPKPVHLIIMGDGYTSEDYSEGGKFDCDVDTAVDAFFTPEPFASYRDYFRISTVAVYSQESGATVRKDMKGCPLQSRNTAFHTVFEGGSSTEVTCEKEKAFTYALTVPDVTEEELQNTTVLMIVNLNVRAGTCLMEKTGRSVSICPAGPTFSSIVSHEGGGHGFGRLLDEYRYNSGAPDPTLEAEVNEWRSYDPYYGYNISFTNDASKVHWGHFIGREGYDAVGFYEGALMYSKGIWRPEEISCMEDDSKLYYNAPSREAIVRRIFKAAGKSFSLQDFYTLDKVKSYNTTTKVRSNPIEEFAPLAPPVLFDR